jgi:hypothetical protein
MSDQGSASSSNNGVPTTRGLAWAPEGSAIAGVIGAQLQIDVAAADPNSSTWRVDAVDEWLDPAPYRDDAAGPRMRVTVAAGCPNTDKGQVGVKNDGTDLDAALLPAGTPTAGLISYYNGLNGTAFELARFVKLDAAEASRLANAVRASELSHLDDTVTSCPMDDGSLALLVLSYHSRPDVDLAYWYTGCPSVANGHISGAPSEQLVARVDPRVAASSPAP